MSRSEILDALKNLGRTNAGYEKFYNDVTSGNESANELFDYIVSTNKISTPVDVIMSFRLTA